MFEIRTDGAIARITLDRPAARNAIPLAGWDALARAVRDAQAGGMRLLVIAGSEAAFSAGADLGDFPAMGGDVAAAGAFREKMRHGIEAVASAQVPTVALVEGPCFGAAVGLALACDLRLAGRNARFAITPAKIGISYPQEDVFRLVSLVGRGAAAKLLLTGSAVDAAEALRIGLADACADKLDAIASAILETHPASHAALKRGIALAASGVACDPGQDRTFDALIASERLAERLEARRRR
jgi:enoyl-CoA hydratase/carnithine racemase